MSRTAIFVVGVVLVVLAGIVVLLVRGPAPARDESLQASGVAFTGYAQDGTEAWSVRAESGSLDVDVGHLQAVDLTFYESGEPQITVHGDQLQRNSSGSTLSGNVRVTQGSDLSLETDTLLWDERNDVLESGPVTLETQNASISAGAFHHDLDTGLTMLTRGIDARVDSNGDTYTIVSDSAEATSEQIVLLGDVSVESSTGDLYRCGRIESEMTGSALHLSEDVSGTWEGSAFTAASVEMDESGIRMQGDVTIDLELLGMEAAS